MNTHVVIIASFIGSCFCPLSTPKSLYGIVKAIMILLQNTSLALLTNMEKSSRLAMLMESSQLVTRFPFTMR